MRYVVDENGEIVDKIEDGDRILRGKSREYLLRQGENEKLPKDALFIKMFKDALPELASEGLTIPESRVFFYLLENVRYESNVAKYNTGELITRDHICFDMKMSLSNVQRAIVRLCQRGLVAITKIDVGKVFIVNPFVAMRGNSIDKTTYDLFKKTKWARSWKIGEKN
jgi:hypothetical protein